MVSPPMDPSLSLWLSFPYTPPLTPSSSASASRSGALEREVASSLQPLRGLLSVPNGADHATYSQLQVVFCPFTAMPGARTPVVNPYPSSPTIRGTFEPMCEGRYRQNIQPISEGTQNMKELLDDVGSDQVMTRRALYRPSGSAPRSRHDVDQMACLPLSSPLCLASRIFSIAVLCLVYDAG